MSPDTAAIMLTAVIAHFLALISPGPDFLLVVRSALRNSRRRACGVALGLLWAQFAAPANAACSATLLFLVFVLAAAAWGAFSSGNRGILLKQGLPAALARAALAAACC